jgi:hypothetical protein|tara:strand:+ start:1622 stop:1864 length:243 start_codon:yes stop_codon:yes gene_type:complete
MTIKDIGFSYEYITEKDKRNAVERQLAELEANHFSLTLIEPSKLKESQQHIQWRQQKLTIENTIKKLRETKRMMFTGEEE